MTGFMVGVTVYLALVVVCFLLWPRFQPRTLATTYTAADVRNKYETDYARHVHFNDGTYWRLRRDKALAEQHPEYGAPVQGYIRQADFLRVWNA